jgi:hypothetical protein
MNESFQNSVKQSYQDEHGEEESDGADHAGRGDWNRFCEHARVQEPRQWKSEINCKII